MSTGVTVAGGAERFVSMSGRLRGAAAGSARSGGHDQERSDDHRRQELAEPSQVEDVVCDDAAQQRTGDAEERRLDESQLLAPRDEHSAETADHKADDAVPDQ